MNALATAIPAPSFWTIFAVVAAVWLLPTVLIGAWIWADRWLDGRHAAEVVDIDPTGDLTFQQMCVERWEAEL